MGEMLRYAIDLRSKTGGRGTFKLTFSHYEDAPPHVQDKVVAETKAKKAEAEKK
jgi:elongation factor G